MSPDGGLRPGLLVAVVGPSGVGKDSLMRAAARHAALDGRVRFARRVVTRAAVADSEDHDSLNAAAFAQARAANAFALCWSAHGLDYGLPRATMTEVAAGFVMVANLSRGSLTEALGVFGRLFVVEATARADTLLRRLAARGRETEETIRHRLARQVSLEVPPGAEGHLRLDNSDDLETAADLFVSCLNGLSARFANRAAVINRELLLPHSSRSEPQG